jgi:Superinfection immunity protein
MASTIVCPDCRFTYELEIPKGDHQATCLNCGLEFEVVAEEIAEPIPAEPRPAAPVFVESTPDVDSVQPPTGIRRWLNWRSAITAIGLILMPVIPVVILRRKYPDAFASIAESIGSEAGLRLLILLWTVLYFLPAVIAFWGKHPHRAGIMILNTFWGWTIIGWFAALIWAVCNPHSVSTLVERRRAEAAAAKYLARNPFD